MSELSVVIPTRDRLPSLLGTITSLAGARGSAGLEVVVVDDGSAKPLAPDLAGAAGELDLRVIRQEPAGLNVARTAGVEATSGPAVAFLDDDVTVDPDWPDGMRAALVGNEEIAVAAGRTLADPEAPIPDWVSPEKLLYLSVLDLGDDPGPMPEFATPVGANLGVTRAWLDRAGGFRAGLDRVGRSLISGGDTDLVRRIEALGGRVSYWPAATVHHRIPADRLTRSWFRQRALAQGVSDVRSICAGRRPGPRRVAFEAVRPLRAAGIAAKRVLARRDLIDAELWLWSSRGRWRELRRSLRGNRP